MATPARSAHWVCHVARACHVAQARQSLQVYCGWGTERGACKVANQRRPKTDCVSLPVWGSCAPVRISNIHTNRIPFLQLWNSLAERLLACPTIRPSKTVRTWLFYQQHVSPTRQLTFVCSFTIYIFSQPESLGSEKLMAGH